MIILKFIQERSMMKSKLFTGTLMPLLILVFLAGVSCHRAPRVEAVSYTVAERGVWLNRSELFAPREELLKLLDDLKAANITSVYINTYFRGCVVYPDSEFLPIFAEASEPDVLSWLIPEIHRRGMRAESWVEYGFYAFHTPDASKTEKRGVFLEKHPELTAVDSSGRDHIHNTQWGDFFSLCPANPKSHELLGNLFVEGIKRYPFDGINLDRMRFPNENFCYCEYCKTQFQKDTGIPLKPYPADSPEYKTFISWRESQLDTFIKTWAPRFRDARPGLKVTMAALPPDMMESHGQNWDHWLEQGWVDAAMPMLYGEKGFEDRIRILSKFPRWDRIYPGVDAHGLSPEVIQRQIRFLNKEGAQGCVLWYSGQIADDLPGLAAGPFSQPARSPLSSGKSSK